jgi:hypothetical protein
MTKVFVSAHPIYLVTVHEDAPTFFDFNKINARKKYSSSETKGTHEIPPGVWVSGVSIPSIIILQHLHTQLYKSSFFYESCSIKVSVLLTEGLPAIDPCPPVRERIIDSARTVRMLRCSARARQKVYDHSKCGHILLAILLPLEQLFRPWSSLRREDQCSFYFGKS